MNEKSQLSKHFIGIDVGKMSFDVAIWGQDKTYCYVNNKSGVLKFFKTHLTVLKESLVVLEATGGYEKSLLLFLTSHDISVHHANPRKVKFFIRSFGTQAKTDTLDAKALSQYAYERHETLSRYHAKDIVLETLAKLIKRRQELVIIRTQEKNRASGPDRTLLIKSSKLILKALDRAIKVIDEEFKELQRHPTLKSKHETLKQVYGIGDKVALTLLATMPELGTITNKQAASLAGVAPHPKQSGQANGYRRTCGGRQNVKPILFLAAMTAARSKSELGNFYNRLIQNGKKPIVAIVAVMRKIIVIANAKLRDLLNPKLNLTT